MTEAGIIKWWHIQRVELSENLKIKKDEAEFPIMGPFRVIQRFSVAHHHNRDVVREDRFVHHARMAGAAFEISCI